MDNVGPMAVGAPGRYMKSDFGPAQKVKIHKSSFIFWGDAGDVRLLWRRK